MVRRILALPWIHTVYDVALAVLVVYLTSSYDQAYDSVIGWAMALVLLFRRHRPMKVMWLVTGLALVQSVVATAPAVYDAALLIAMVSVVTHAQSMRDAYTAGAIVLLGVVVTFGGFLPFGEELREGVGDIVAIGGVCAAVWLTAMVLRTRRLYVASLEARAATAEREREHLVQLAAAEERAEIARELHDVVAHSLAVMILQADGAGYALKSDPDKAGSALKAIADTGRDALEDMHRIVRVLRSGRASGQGEAADADADRRRVSLDDLETVAERARTAGLKVALEVEGERAGLSTADELTVLRIVQESLTNVLRHAGPGAEVTITLRFDKDAALVRVVDDGGGRLAGTRPATERAGGGNGLVGMRERVEVSGGSFTAGPRLGAGWQVDAELPLKEPAVRTTG
ncbi:sensor histidine kinase [Streptomyces bluensis]|uniref:sensor histidine kinase n=1 Tax=Streptomyces bluensis TaxID=33897 RepID=UPI0010D8E7DB|nr:histidine kinase [Streptomyces bluensis]GGZ80737.1 two-component sensor histidine kinase [Streptomyces bluensis]